MKTKIKLRAQINGYISENKKEITGSVAEHLLLELKSADQGYHQYLHEDEIPRYEGDQELRFEYQREIEKFITDNYDWPLGFDVVFNSESSSNNKGFDRPFQVCMDYILTRKGSNESYFADYKGGTVSIVCLFDDKVAHEEEIS